MKRKIILSIALALSVVFLSLTSSDSTVKAQQQRRFFVYDTGVITPAAGQILRVTVAPTGRDPITVRFHRMQYMTEGCNGDGVCRQIITSRSGVASGQLTGAEAAHIDVPGNGNGVRVVVGSDSRNARVVAQLIDAATGKVNSIHDGDWSETESD